MLLVVISGHLFDCYIFLFIEYLQSRIAFFPIIAIDVDLRIRVHKN